MTGHEHDDRATPHGRDAGEHEFHVNANHSKGPAASTDQDPSSPSGRALLGSDPAVFSESHPARLAKIEEALRGYGADPRAEAAYCDPPWLKGAGVFDGTAFAPTDREVREARWRVVARWALPPEVFDKGPSSWPPSLPPPIEDGGAVNCRHPLHCAWHNGWHKDERDPEVLRDTVAADSYVCFVPTVEDVVRAMRMEGVAPEFAAGRETPREDPATAAPEEPASELERAMRGAQRAPRPLWPGNSGSPNKLQEWVQFKGRKQYSYNRTLTLQEVVTELLEEGYLKSAPPGEEVKEVLDKMIKEIEEAEARNHERVWRGRR